jgi:hypothetical protein
MSAGNHEISLANRKHLDRFILHKGGKTIDEIAAEEEVRPETIRASIRRVEIAQGYYNQEFLNQSLISIVLSAAPAAQKAVLSALGAQTVRTSKNSKGEEIFVKEPDHETQLKGLAEFREIAKAAQPKPAHQTKIAVGVGVGVNTQASGSYVAMEDRMRDIKQKRLMQPVEDDRRAPVLDAPMVGDSDEEESDE